MADSVIRSDVVQIGFDIDDSPLGSLEAEIRRLQRQLTGIDTDSGFDELTDSVQEADDGVSDLVRTADRLRDTGAEDLQDDLEHAGNAAGDAQQDIRDVGRSADQAANSTDELSDSARESESAFSKLEEVAGNLKGALAAAAGAFAIGGLVSSTNEMMSSMNKFQAQTGASAAEMQEYGDNIKNLYGNAIGESIEDVANSMASVKQVTGLTGKELENTTNNALMMRDVFEFETNESIRAVDMMMKQFGVTADEAYSMIAQGAQNGLNKNDDLLDTVNEYSVHFKQLGFSSEDMFNMLANGAKSGTFSVDKLGDAVKEFGVRAVDGSDTTAEGFAAIGLSADDMARKFKTGGETGKAAFQETIDALKNMEDPIAREAAGVALFGTMWEDLGAEGVFALSNMEGGITQSTDALNEMGDVMYSDVGSALEALKRKGQIFLNEAMTPVLNGVIKVINKFQEWSAKMGIMEKIKSAISSVKEALQPVVQKIGEVISKVYEFATAESTIETIKLAFERVKSIVEPIIEIVQRVIEEIMNIATSQPVVDALQSAFEKIKEVFDNIATAAETVFNFISDNIEWILPLVEGLVIAFAAVKAILIAIKIAQIAYNVVMGITNALMAVSPITWIVLAIGLLIGVIILCIKYWDEIKAAFVAAWEAIKEAWGLASEWFMANVVDPIVQFFTQLWTDIKTGAQALWTTVVGIFTVVASWVYNNIIAPVVNFYTSLWNSIVSISQSIWNGIVNIFSGVGSWFGEKFTQAVNAVKNAFGSVVGFFQNIWNKIKSMFTKIGTTIGNGIADAFKTVVNSVINFAENTINGFIRAINNAIDLINKIPGVEISKISELSIPRLANGGIVDKPTIAEIGEDGKEAVVPLENNLGWVKKVISGVTSAIKSPANAQTSYNSSNSLYKTSNSTTQYNYYTPSFTLNMNGSSASEDNKRKVKQWVRESMAEVFDSLDRINVPTQEV